MATFTPQFASNSVKSTECSEGCSKSSSGITKTRSNTFTSVTQDSYEMSFLNRPQLTNRTFVLKRLEKDLTRGDILKILEKNALSKSLEMLIYKVDSKGESIGESKFIWVSKEESENAKNTLNLGVFGCETVLEAMGDFSEDIEMKLSKEMQMEVKKVERKFKKLFKFPVS